MRRLFLLTYLTLSICLIGQNRTRLKFVDYNYVIAELKKNPNNKRITDKYDFVYILLLDSSELKTIKRTNPNIIDEFRNYSYGLKPKHNFKTLKIKETNIKKLFEDSINGKRIMKLLKPEMETENIKIDSPIYIKQNKAIFDMSGEIWAGTYFAIIENNKLKVFKLVEESIFKVDSKIENNIIEKAPSP